MISRKKDNLFAPIAPVFKTRMDYLAIQIFLWFAGSTAEAKNMSFPVVSLDDSQQIRLNGDWGTTVKGKSPSCSSISVVITRKVMYLQSSENLPGGSLVIYKMEDDTVCSVRKYDSILPYISLNDCGSGIYLLELKGQNGMRLSGKFLLE